jgi:hypothetical protein
MKKLLFLGACLVALASVPAKAQIGGTEVVVVQVYSTGTGTFHLAVTRANGQTEDTEVRDGFNPKDHAGAVACQRAFAKLVQEGYTLKSTFSSDLYRTTTLVFEKRP